MHQNVGHWIIRYEIKMGVAEIRIRRYEVVGVERMVMICGGKK